MRRALKEAGGWALQITKLQEVQLLAASSPSTRGSIIKHLFFTMCLHERLSLYRVVGRPQRVHERGLHSTAGVLYTLLHAEYRGEEFY